MKQILNICMAVILVLTAVPMVFAQNDITVQVGKEYSTFDQVIDRIKLTFTFQEERKIALMDRIEQKREQHYSFLITQGKTEQAERYKNSTIGLIKNFDQWKANRQEIIQKLNSSRNIKN